MASRPLIIKAQSWVPTQIPTSKNLTQSSNYFEQECLKFPGVGQFHTYVELLHAALLEARNTVIRYVPQPLRFRIGSKFYIPDVYVEMRTGVQVIELKPRGEFSEDHAQLLRDYCATRNVEFVVLANEWVYEQQLKAENWLTIIRTLVNGKEQDSESSEQHIIDFLAHHDSITLRHILDFGDRQGSICSDIALFRLLHQGRIRANLDLRQLDLETEFYLC